MASNDFNPATYNSATRDFELGEILEMTFNGVRGLFRYVKVVDAACADGDVMVIASSTSWDVTNDFSGGSAIPDASIARVVGVAVGTISQNQYGFIMKDGIHDAMKVVGSAAAGVSLIGPDTTDGTAEVMATAQEDHVFAQSLTAESGGTCKALVFA